MWKLLLPCLALASVAAQLPPTTLPTTPPGYAYVKAYDALSSLYSAYKYNGNFTGLQVPYPDSLFYISCWTISPSIGASRILLHPTLPRNASVADLAATSPFAFNGVNATYNALSKVFGDRQFFTAEYDFGPSTVATIHKYVLGVIVFGNFQDIGTNFNCHIGVNQTAL